jgi:hypothetical protein
MGILLLGLWLGRCDKAHWGQPEAAPEPVTDYADLSARTATVDCIEFWARLFGYVDGIPARVSGGLAAFWRDATSAS